VPVTVNGTGQTNTTITNGGTTHVFDGSGTGPITVQNLTVQIPASSGHDGISSFDPLTVQNVPFSGRIGTRALKPGHYQASAVARNAAGASPSRAVAFAIVQ
jgi:hypothetical protein